MRGPVIFIALSAITADLVCSWNLKRATWPWNLNNPRTHKRDCSYGHPTSNKCWPEVQDAMVRLLVTIKNLPKDSPSAWALNRFDMNGENANLNLSTPAGIKSLICSIQRNRYSRRQVDIQQGEEPFPRPSAVPGPDLAEIFGFDSAQSLVAKMKAIEKFATYALSNDLFRPPPLTGVDEEETLAQVSEFIDSQGHFSAAQKDFILEQTRMYIKSDSLEEVLLHLNETTSTQYTREKLLQGLAMYKVQMEAIILMANPVVRAAEAAESVGAFHKLVSSPLADFFRV